MTVSGAVARIAQRFHPIPKTASVGLVLILSVAGIGEAAWAASGSWVGQVPRQVVAISQRPLESDPITPPLETREGDITRVRWSLRVDRPAPALESWLCQGRLCVPLTGLRGETQRFAGRDASMPFRLRFRWQPESRHHTGQLVVSGGQVIVDYRDTDEQTK